MNKKLITTVIVAVVLLILFGGGCSSYNGMVVADQGLSKGTPLTKAPPYRM